MAQSDDQAKKKALERLRADLRAITAELDQLENETRSALDQKRAEELGVDDYLIKSQVVIADVIERIKQHLGLANA